MEKIISCSLLSGHYKADACIVWCFDDRFTKALEEFVKSRGYQHYDLIKIAGRAKSLSSPNVPGDRDFLLRQIKTSIALHKAPKVILMNHCDCGAYAGEKDKEKYIKELQLAKEHLSRALIDLIEIELLFVDFDGIYSV